MAARKKNKNEDIGGKILRWGKEEVENCIKTGKRPHNAIFLDY